MSKDKKKTPVVSEPEVVLTPEPVPTPPTPPTPPTANASGTPLGSVVPVPVAHKERLLDIDRMALELARQQRATALAEARTALAQNEKAELAYKYVVLQLYMKYGLSDADAISETGDIVRGGALAPPPQKQQ